MLLYNSMKFGCYYCGRVFVYGKVIDYDFFYLSTLQKICFRDFILYDVMEIVSQVIIGYK